MKTISTLQKRSAHQVWSMAAPCRHRRGAVVSGRSRTVLDDSGSLAISAWICADCGVLMEEIHILSRDGKAAAQPVRYTVSARTTQQSVVSRH